MESINFLLATVSDNSNKNRETSCSIISHDLQGLLKAMKDTKGNVSFRAVMKKEMEVSVPAFARELVLCPLS